MARSRSGLCFVLIIAWVLCAPAPASAQENESHWEKLTDRAAQLKNAGRYQEALPLAQQALQEAEASSPGDSYLAVTLTCVGEIYEHLGQYEKAESLELRALGIAEEVLGPHDPGLTVYLNALATTCNAEGKLADAERALTRVVRLDEKRLKADDPERAGDLSNLGSIYYQQGKYEKAQPLFEQALRIDEKAGPGSAAVALDLSSLGLLFEHEAKYSEAEGLLKRALDLDEKAKAAEDPDIGMDLVNLGLVYSDEARYEAALPLYQRAQGIFERTFGTEHPDVAMADSKIGLVEDHLGRYREAEPMLRRALEIDEKALGPEHQNVATDLYNLGLVEDHQNRYAEAQPLVERALKIDEKVLGPEHPDVANALEELGEIDFYLGRYEDAVALYRRALEILEKAEGPEHNDVAHALDDLGSVYDTMGRYTDAEPLDRRALAIQDKVLGPEHPEAANSLQALAALLMHEGRYAEAEPLVERELRIREKKLGPENTQVADALNNLAALYYKEGKFTEAEPLYLRAIRIDARALGENAPGVATDLNNTALLLQAEGKLGEARDLFEKALAIDEKSLGPDKPEVALCLTNLAAVDEAEAKFADAEPRLKRALAIDEKTAGGESPTVAVDLNNLAVVYAKEQRYAEAEPLYQRLIVLQEKVLGPDHPDLGSTLMNDGLLYEYEGKYAQAQPLFQRSFDNLFRQFQYNFTYMTEKERLGFLDTVAADFPAYFSFVHRYHEKDPELIGSMYNLLLWEKGFIAGSVADMRRQIEASGDAEALKLLESLTEERTQIAALLNAQPQNREAWQARIEQLRSEADATEKALVERSDAFAERKKLDRTTWQQVRDALGPGDAAVEFARFRFYDGNWTDKSYYAALVVTRESKEEPQYIFLGESTPIERDALIRFQIHLQTRSIITMRETVVPGQDAYGLIWKPLEPALEGKRRIFVAADGALNQIPLGIIEGPDGKLEMEKYEVRLVSSTRDLLRPEPDHGSWTALLMGNPSFDLSGTQQSLAEGKVIAAAAGSHAWPSTLDLGEVSRDQGAGMTLPPLPGTGAEVSAIADLMRSRGWKPRVYTGDVALKEVVERASSPRIVHLATHGFFLPDQQATSRDLETREFGAKEEMGLEDPMLRSGLYFAGANRTLAGKGGTAETDNGVLTAMEAANLNLRGTELVVLSACNTGQGEVRNGEGVFGLRRALEEAGAQHVLMSLWSVPDEETLDLMTRFYTKWLSGTEIHAALEQAQLEMRDKVKAAHGGRDLPFYWGAFVLVGK
jgi:tetratricopeptide (TPR) repeat protein